MADEMVGLNDPLRQLTAGLLPATPPVGSLTTLIRLKPTAKLRSELAAHEATLRPTSPLGRDDWEREKRRLVEHVAWGEQRDALQASRPADCWCLGLGGRDERYLTVDSDVVSYDTYCPCPDGLAARARAEQLATQLAREREHRRLERLFANSHLPVWTERCRLETYAGRVRASAGHNAGLAAARLIQQLSGWLDALVAGTAPKRSLFIWGKYGVGKTGLAAAVLRTYAEQTGHACLFTTVPDLLDRIRATYGDHAAMSESELLTLVRTVPFALLDDLGAERVTEWVAERLFVVVNARHDADLPTLFTSNITLQGLAAHLGERTMWRITDMAEIIHLDGPNLRAERKEAPRGRPER
jgi:DNA replication protein DnaC